MRRKDTGYILFNRLPLGSCDWRLVVARVGDTTKKKKKKKKSEIKQKCGEKRVLNGCDPDYLPRKKQKEKISYRFATKKWKKNQGMKKT